MITGLMSGTSKHFRFSQKRNIFPTARSGGGFSPKKRLAISCALMLGAAGLAAWQVPAAAVVDGQPQKTLTAMPFVGYYHAAKVFPHRPSTEDCGTTLISDIAAVTAAHCLAGYTAGQMTVTFDRASRNGSGGQQRKVSQVILPPNYNSNSFTPDYGILILKSPVQDLALPVVSPACPAWQAGSPMTVVGWGASGRPMDYHVSPENAAQQAAVQYAKTDLNYSYVTENTDFRTAKTGTLQFGDSGDGLFYKDPTGRYELLGVLHDISRNATPGALRTDQFTRLDVNSVNYPNFSQYIDIESAGVPATPVGLTAVSGSQDVKISWSPPPAPACPAAAVTGYNVHITGGGIDKVVQLQAYQTSWDFSGLTNGTTYTIYVAAVNKAGVGATTSTVAVAGGNSASLPVITTTGLPNGIVGQNYNQDLSTADQRSGTWSVSAGSLPPGLTLTGSAIQGVPTAVGVSDFTVTFTDANGQTASVALSITVRTASQWTAVEGGEPTNANPNNIYSYGTSASCTTSSTCVAVGGYVAVGATAEYTTAELLTQANGTWTASGAPLPANAQSQGDAGMNSVSCASASACVAVGQYTDSTGNDQGLLLTLAGGSWTPTEAHLPADAGTGHPAAELRGVSCSSTAACIAVGDYLDSAGNQQGLLLTLAGGSWTAVDAPLPANAASGSGRSVVLNSVSCASASACVAVGQYTDSAGHDQGLLLTLAGGSWTPAEAPLPPGAASNPFTFLNGVSCPSATACVATGDYEQANASGSDGLFLTWSGGAWTPANAPLPAGVSGSPVVYMTGISCPSSSACVATGYYSFTVNVNHGELLTLSNGSWSAIDAPVPANAYTPPESIVLGVSCPAAMQCTAVGDYQGDGGVNSLLLSGAA